MNPCSNEPSFYLTAWFLSNARHLPAAMIQWLFFFVCRLCGRHAHLPEPVFILHLYSFQRDRFSVFKLHASLFAPSLNCVPLRVYLTSVVCLKTRAPHQ